MTAALAAILFACGGETTIAPPSPPLSLAAASFDPDREITFADAIALTPSPRVVRVRSTGDATYVVVRTEIIGAINPARWRVDLSDALRRGLPPSETSTLTVSYTPCAEALRPGVDPATIDTRICGLFGEQARLRIVDNSSVGTRSIPLFGDGVQPPKLGVRCNFGCGEERVATMNACDSLLFGDMDAGEPCDIHLTVENEPFPGEDTAPLNIEAIDITVVAENGDIVSGREAGLSLRTTEGAAVALPFELGGTPGRQLSHTILVHHDGRPGRWSASTLGGLVIRSNDRGRTPKHIPISADVRSAVLVAEPPALSFGPTLAGASTVRTLAMGNLGSDPLIVESISTDRPEFRVLRAPSLPSTLGPGERISVELEFEPSLTASTAFGSLGVVVVRHGSRRQIETVPLAGGAAPLLARSPRRRLSLPPEQPTPFQVINVGHGSITLSRPSIQPAGRSFTFSDCIDGACVFPLALCGAATAGCASPGATLSFERARESGAGTANFENSAAVPITIELLPRDDLVLEPTIVLDVAEVAVGDVLPARVELDGERVIDAVWWHWITAPSEGPASTSTAPSSSIRITQPGLHILGAHVRTSDGRVSQTPAVRTFVVP